MDRSEERVRDGPVSERKGRRADACSRRATPTALTSLSLYSQTLSDPWLQLIKSSFVFLISVRSTEALDRFLIFQIVKKTGAKEHEKRVCSREEAVVYANSKEGRFSCTIKMKPVKV